MGRQRHLLRANGSTLVKPGYIAVYQEGRDDAVEDDSDHMLPRDAGGRHGAAGRAPSGAALHRAAAALHRSLAGQGARGARHRPALDLCLDHLDAARSRVRRDRKPALHRHRHRPHRRPLPDRAFPPLRRIRLYGGDGRRARRGGARRGALDHAAGEILEALHPPGRADREIGVARAGRAGARARHAIRRAASR